MNEPIQAPAVVETKSENQLILEQLKAQNDLLNKINGKLGFFVFLTILGIIFSFFGAL